METSITALGALFGLILAIFLITKKVHPVYGMMIGALFGGLLGGAELAATIGLMIGGAGDMMQTVLRILSAGVLVGVLLQTGAAQSIAETLVKKGGTRGAIPALALASMFLTMVGVFVDVAVITVAPIGLALGQKMKMSRMAILLAMIGGGKAGNIMSPNPNTIVLSENLGVPLSDLMLAGLIPALGALMVTCFFARILCRHQDIIQKQEASPTQETTASVSFFTAITAPAVAVFLLALRPICGIVIDPLLALPLGGVVGLIAMRKVSTLNSCMKLGLDKMAPVALFLIGTGCLAGIISHSTLKDLLITLIQRGGLPGYSLAPLSGILFCGATASTVAGCTLASSLFGQTIQGMGVSPLSAGIMIHTGCTTFDTLPHGSFFHSSGGSVQMEFGNRLRLIPYEVLIGGVQTLIATLLFGILGIR